MRIAYLVDSSISINKKDDFLNNDDTFFVPLQINIDGKDYLDDEKLDRNALINKMVSAKKVVTSQPSPASVNEVLEDIISKKYDVVVCALIASGLSGTQNLVYSIAIEKKLAIVNLDSKGVGPSQIYALRMFKDAIKNGYSLIDAQTKVQHMLDLSNSYAIVNDLNYLQRGGRITKLSANIGTLLKIKPIVMADKELNGKVVNIDKARTKQKAYQRFIEIAFKDLNIDEYFYVIGDFGAEEDSKQLKEMILSTYPSISVEIMDLCFAVGAHTGPYTLAIFITKK